MALVLSDEQIMLRDNARGFLSKKAPIAHLRHLRDTHDADGFSRPLWKVFVVRGCAGIVRKPGAPKVRRTRTRPCRSRRRHGGAWSDADSVTISVNCDPRGQCAR